MEVDEDASFYVHQQLQDVIKAQKEVFAHLNENKSNGDKYRVSREEYDALLSEMEKERNDHLECQALLKAERLRREFAEGEVEILKAQMERERKKYEECFQKLKNKAVEESARKSEIESQCSIIAYEKQQKEDLVHLNESKIHDLKKRLSKQKKSHQSQMDEINIRIQQEAYINKTLAEKEKNKKSR